MRAKRIKCKIFWIIKQEECLKIERIYELNKEFIITDIRFTYYCEQIRIWKNNRINRFIEWIEITNILFIENKPKSLTKNFANLKKTFKINIDIKINSN
jgi:hypothetical protein